MPTDDPDAQLREPSSLPSALRDGEAFSRRLGGRGPALFLDYDGTLTSIATTPDRARLPDRRRALLRELASRAPVVIVSGRDRDDVKGLVKLPELIYAGSHGFDIAGPGGLRMELEEARGCLPALARAGEELERLLADVAGVLVERKRFAISVHYRNVAPEAVDGIERHVDQALAGHPRLSKGRGRKLFELRPRLDWDKGKAVRWLMGRLGIDGVEVAPVYIGDDRTDEDAFREVAADGVGILVGAAARRTYARFVLRDPAEVEQFLRQLSVGS